MRSLVFVAILANILIASLGQRSPDGENICPDALNRFTNALLRTSVAFLKSYADSSPGETGTVSGYAAISIAAALGLFAQGESRNQIYNTLGIRSRNEIVCVADVTNYPVYHLPDCIEVGISIGIYGNTNYQFTPDFIGNVTDIIGATAKNFNFADADETANAINAIVANQTYNRIPSIIDGSSTSLFNSSTQLVSVNGWSFKSEWEIEFQTGKILEFKISQDKSAPQEFLYQDAVYLYGHSDTLGAKVAQVNFCKGSNFYLWVIVPDQPFTESDLINKMNQNIDWYNELKQGMKPTRLDLYIIRYNKSTMVDSKALFLDAANISSIYDDDTLKLRGAIKGGKPAALSASIQETYVTSSPNGGPVPNGPLSNGTKTTFMANTPHVFIIFRDREVYVTAVIRGPISSNS